MTRIPLSSSRIASVGYDSEKLIMEVEVHEGVFQFLDVPEREYQKFMESKSKGKHFFYFIENVYEKRKLELVGA